MSLLTGPHASASWLVGVARVASSLYSCSVIGSLRFPSSTKSSVSLLYMRSCTAQAAALARVSPQTRGQGLFLTIAGHEYPETIQQGKQDVCAAFDTTALIHCGIEAAAER